MVDVIGVHGISQQQLGRNQLMGAWQGPARDGLERFTGHRSGRPSLDIGFYGDLFLEETASKGAPVDADLGDADDDVLDFLLEIQEDYAADEPPDRKEAKKGMSRLPGPLTKLGAALERRFGVAGKVLFFGDLPQVRKYQRDDHLAEGIRGRVTVEITAGKPPILLGHSLGSIVAYEVLCMMPDHGVKTLVTIGSPLGMRSIRDALRPAARERIPALPPGVDRWVNVYDTHDPVSLAGGLSGIWTQVTDDTVDNEDEAHSATRYLGKRQVGNAFALGLGLA
jgi:hypothetical protein